MLGDRLTTLRVYALLVGLSGLLVVAAVLIAHPAPSGELGGSGHGVMDHRPSVVASEAAVRPPPVPMTLACPLELGRPAQPAVAGYVRPLMIDLCLR